MGWCLHRLSMTRCLMSRSQALLVPQCHVHEFIVPGPWEEVEAIFCRGLSRTKHLLWFMPRLALSSECCQPLLEMRKLNGKEDYNWPVCKQSLINIRELLKASGLYGDLPVHNMCFAVL